MRKIIRSNFHVSRDSLMVTWVVEGIWELGSLKDKLVIKKTFMTMLTQWEIKRTKLSKCRYSESVCLSGETRHTSRWCVLEPASLRTNPVDQFVAEDVGESVCSSPELFLCVPPSSPFLLCTAISIWLCNLALLTQPPQIKGPPFTYVAE